MNFASEDCTQGDGEYIRGSYFKLESFVDFQKSIDL